MAWTTGECRRAQESTCARSCRAARRRRASSCAFREPPPERPRRHAASAVLVSKDLNQVPRIVADDQIRLQAVACGERPERDRNVARTQLVDGALEILYEESGLEHAERQIRP